MAAPGAIVIGKIIYPQTEIVENDVNISKEKIGSNLLSAISIGTGEGIKMAVNVGAMLLVFIALIAMLSNIFLAPSIFLSLSKGEFIAFSTASWALLSLSLIHI